MTNGTKLYFQKGTLHVEAKGFWFSGGGEKGAFGYYPHLKDAQAYPVYPDTQIRGDLAMAARWLDNLDGGIWKDTIDLLFGGQGKETTTPFFLTDLTLADESRKQWDKDGGRFADKARIAVEDNRTVEEHMLVSFEYAFLDGLTLDAKFYLGYFKDSQKLESAAALLSAAVPFLSGFGAFRSRGYGRGKMEIKWDEPVCVSDSESANTCGKKMTCFLDALTHVRNRPLDPEGSQVIAARRSLSAAQTRGWIARAYHDLYGVWPMDEQMASVICSDFHPAPANDFALTYPPPRTTVRTEEKIIKDLADKTGKSGINDDDEPQEALVRSKSKPLSDSCFVTAAPSVYETPSVTRFRNVMAEAGDFRTKDEGGLFAQEYLPSGTRFSGTIALPDSPFGRRCLHLLESVKPVIAGTLFHTHLSDFTAAGAAGSLKTHLLCADHPYDRDILKGAGNSLCLSTRRAFNTANGRPRRNRMVISAGAVLTDEKPPFTLPWPGFGMDNIPDLKDARSQKALTAPVAGPQITIPAHIQEKLGRISRAQAGQLRELLHPGLTAAYLKKYLHERLNKYDQWNKDKPDERLLPKDLLQDLKDRINKDNANIENIRAYIAAVHSEIRRQRGNSKLQRNVTQGGKS